MAAVMIYWPGDDFCCGYLVRPHVGSRYLGQDLCRLRTSMPHIGFPGAHVLCKAIEDAGIRYTARWTSLVGLVCYPLSVSERGDITSDS